MTNTTETEAVSGIQEVIEGSITTRSVHIATESNYFLTAIVLDDIDLCNTLVPMIQTHAHSLLLCYIHKQKPLSFHLLHVGSLGLNACVC